MSAFGCSPFRHMPHVPSESTAARFYCSTCNVWWSGSHVCGTPISSSPAGGIFVCPLTEERVREIVREEMRKAAKP